MSAHTITHTITVVDTDIVFSCREDQFIIEAMFKNAKGPITYGCFGGGCGACKMRLISGEVLQVKKMSKAHISDEEKEGGYVLICCIQPRGDVVLARVDKK